MMVSLLIIKQMAMESRQILKVPNIKDPGKMIKRKDMEKNNGKMAHFLQVITNKD